MAKHLIKIRLPVIFFILSCALVILAGIASANSTSAENSMIRPRRLLYLPLVAKLSSLVANPTPTASSIPTYRPTITPPPIPSDTPTITLTYTCTVTRTRTPTPTSTCTPTFTPTVLRTGTVFPTPTTGPYPAPPN